MNDKLEKLKSLMAEIADLDRAIALVGWDQQVNMPHGGAEDRGNILSTLAELEHQKATSDDVGQLLDDL